MSITRRGFLQSGATLAVGAACVPSSFGAEEIQGKPQGVFRISSQIGIIPGKDLPEKLANMEKWGFDAVELYGDAVNDTKKYAEAVKNTKLKISAICGARGGANGDLVSDVVEKRAPAFEDLQRALDAAGELGSTGVIYVPAFNGQTKLCNKEIRKILLDKLPPLVDLFSPRLILGISDELPQGVDETGLEKINYISDYIS